MRIQPIEKFLLAVVAVLVLVMIYTAGQASSAPHYRLVGYGCGPERETMLAQEEDHFPECERIEPIDL